MSLLGVVEVGQIFEVIWVSLIAGIGITTTFSFVVLGTARSAEARRAGRAVVSLAYGLLATMCMILVAASFVFAIEVMLTKK
jgi:hypothetical protein